MKKNLSSNFNLLVLLLILVGINLLASVFHSRIDLTKEKRYTLSKATKELLRSLDEPVRIDVFFKGNYPAGFKKIVNSVQEFLQETREYAHGNITVRYTDPLKGLANDSLAARFADSMDYFFGLRPYTIQAPSKIGDELNIKQVLPGAVIRYKDTAIGVNLFKGLKNYGTEQEQLAALYNDVESTLEYKFASAIQKITSTSKPLIGYALGNGEIWGPNVDDAVRTLIHDYRFDTVNLKQIPYVPSVFNALVILKPTKTFSDEDKLKIDQYVMRGGKIFWMIDNMYAEFDSLYKSQGFIAFDRGLNLEDILFRYGVRLNENLLQDMQCDKMGQIDPNSKQTRLVDWPFFPILNGTNTPISKNLDGVRAMFPNTLDTVKADGIKKTFLLKSSANARVLTAPARIDFEFFQIAPDIKEFTVHDTAVAALLEGKFKSLYSGRIPKSFVDSMSAYHVPVKDISDTPTKMIVVADGDIAMNLVSPQYGPLPMGFNFYTNYTFSNKEFFTNCLEYLVNPSGILETRAKDFTLRLLDLKKVKEQKTTWQFINIALPVLLIILLGFIYQQFRRKKYAA
ncbi:MAG TPA: gliding motility-associated ABC transporter substrate-binding protein GldG [Chitinophagaceae bacterium]|jgi:gliding-associated putative ABC transporter substrate-binding component GldG|nr:gliding motility-associated ABC transporter substrate-binding protein GldG [Chitinophagaceae bacterium]